MRFDPEEIDQFAEAISKKIIERLRPLLPPMIEGLLDVKGIANHLKISRTKVYKMIKKHGIPYKRIGGCIRFNWKEVDAYFEAQGLNPTGRQTP